MLLRNRAPQIEAPPANTARGYEHVSGSAVAVINWLNCNRVEYVLVGPIARAIRGETKASGPVAIVPAPYGRNLDRLARALTSAHARLRPSDARSIVSDLPQETVPVKLDGWKLLSPERWPLRCGEHDIDVEPRTPDSPRYQEVLYEATRFEVAADVGVEVAAPEDIEHYDHVRRTGVAPELTVRRVVRDPGQST
jgi:hypothetical protein